MTSGALSKFKMLTANPAQVELQPRKTFCDRLDDWYH